MLVGTIQTIRRISRRTRRRATTATQSRPNPSGRLGPGVEGDVSSGSIDLYWLPLGAGGWFVRLNGRIYETIKALLERRRPLDLYHSALEVRVPEGRFIIENAWPIPDANGASRGVVIEGPVGTHPIARFRPLRYEVRRWRDGVIADADEAVESPQRLSDDLGQSRRILELVPSVPSLVWGRDELRTGEMWNSNSVVSWLLARSGLAAEVLSPPAGGRAPGWGAGLVTARRKQPSVPRRHIPGSGGGLRTPRPAGRARSAPDACRCSRRWSRPPGATSPGMGPDLPAR